MLYMKTVFQSGYRWTWQAMKSEAGGMCVLLTQFHDKVESFQIPSMLQCVRMRTTDWSMLQLPSATPNCLDRPVGPLPSCSGKRPSLPGTPGQGRSLWSPCWCTESSQRLRNLRILQQYPDLPDKVESLHKAWRPGRVSKWNCHLRCLHLSSPGLASSVKSQLEIALRAVTVGWNHLCRGGAELRIWVCVCGLVLCFTIFTCNTLYYVFCFCISESLLDLFVFCYSTLFCSHFRIYFRIL